MNLNSGFSTLAEIWYTRIHLHVLVNQVTLAANQVRMHYHVTQQQTVQANITDKCIHVYAHFAQQHKTSIHNSISQYGCITTSTAHINTFRLQHWVHRIAKWISKAMYYSLSVLTTSTAQNTVQHSVYILDGIHRHSNTLARNTPQWFCGGQLRNPLVSDPTTFTCLLYPEPSCQRLWTVSYTHLTLPTTAEV